MPNAECRMPKFRRKRVLGLRGGTRAQREPGVCPPNPAAPAGGCSPRAVDRSEDSNLPAPSFGIRHSTFGIPLLLLATLISFGCSGPKQESGLNADEPRVKIDAIIQAARTRDRQALPGLVEQLDSDDPAVRLFAIGALRRITDWRFGYNPFQPPERSREAIDRWARAVEQELARSPEPEGKTRGRDPLGPGKP
jgi:hypothetical protein